MHERRTKVSNWIYRIMVCVTIAFLIFGLHRAWEMLGALLQGGRSVSISELRILVTASNMLTPFIGVAGFLMALIVRTGAAVWIFAIFAAENTISLSIVVFAASAITGLTIFMIALLAALYGVVFWVLLFLAKRGELDRS